MCRGPRNQSDDVNDHLGFLTQWTSTMKRAGNFPLWEHDELFNQAYITTHELLKEKYNPSRGAVITFLKAFLWGRVLYAYGKSFGWRYRDSKWRVLEVPMTRQAVSKLQFDPVDYPPDLTEREKEVLEMRVGGYSLQAIANHFGFSSPNTVTYWMKNHIQPKFEGRLEDGN